MALAGPLTPYFHTKDGFARCEICGKIGEEDTWYLAKHPDDWDRNADMGPCAYGSGGQRHKSYWNTYPRKVVGHREKIFHFNCGGRYWTFGYCFCHDCDRLIRSRLCFRDREHLHEYADSQMPYQIEARQRWGGDKFKIYSHTEFKVGQVVKVPGSDHDGKKKNNTLNGRSNFEYITIIEKKDEMVIVEPYHNATLNRAAAKIRDWWKEVRPSFEKLETFKKMIPVAQSEIDLANQMMKKQVRGGVIVINEEVEKIEKQRRKAELRKRKLNIMIRRMEREQKAHMKKEARKTKLYNSLQGTQASLSPKSWRDAMNR